MPRLVTYLRDLRIGKITLWCYLIWYVVMVGFYFDPRLSLWLNSIGISIVIGMALILSVMPAGGLRVMDRWAVARLFMMPLAVSSFAALIKDRGFVVIFSPRWIDNLIAIGMCALFVVVTLVCKSIAQKP